jgi:ectoine hydroxylase-related dioxygenase (phytanoyl-CoA dioxygenase family)
MNTDTPSAERAPAHRDRLPRAAPPHDWRSIDALVRTTGGVVVERLLADAAVRRLNGEIDAYLSQHPRAGAPRSGNRLYDDFLGHGTLRLQGLTEKLPSAAELVGHEALVEWAQRLMAPLAGSVLLNAAELIQIGPGEPAQLLHRDSDSWPAVPLGETPFIVNAIVALDAFTLENGATHVFPESWAWDAARRPLDAAAVRATMRPGDALCFRGDLLHGGGANTSDRPRRAISISYCVGWLRTVEAHFLHVPPQRARSLPRRVRELLGYAVHDGTRQAGGLLGLYECGDPAEALEDPRR